MADIVGLQCTTCKRRNYVTLVNKKKATKKLEKRNIASSVTNIPCIRSASR